MIDLTPIVNAVIALSAALVTAFLIPWLKQKLSMEKQQDLHYWLKVAVEAAEEYYAESGCGAEKAAYVRAFLAERGIKLNDQEAAALINAAVWDLINRFGKSWQDDWPEEV